MTIPYEEIEDSGLRTELENLSLEIPHANTVVDPKIGDFSKAMYHKLLAMEAYTYEHSEQPEELKNEVPDGTAGYDQYNGYWSDFISGIMSYINHAPIPNIKIKDLVVGIYCFMGVHTSRGFGDISDLDKANAKDIFVFNGFIDTILGYPLNYYDDFIPEDKDLLPEPGEESSIRLTEDAVVVTEKWDPDAAKVDALISEYADVVSDATVNALFTAPVEPTEVLDAAGVWDKIMIELNWQWYIDFFGSTVNIPPRPDF